MSTWPQSFPPENQADDLLQTDLQYDIITTDATHPSNASSWALFTREFYTMVQQRLSSDGVFMQWLPFHSLTEADFKTIIRTFHSVFPHATLWYTGGSHTFLVSTPQRLTEERLTGVLARAEDKQIVQDDLGPPDVISSYLVWDEDALKAAPRIREQRLFSGESTFVAWNSMRGGKRGGSETLTGETIGGRPSKLMPMAPFWIDAPHKCLAM